MNSTLVIVTAETGAFRATFDAFKRNLLDVFDADLALCVGEAPDENRDNPFHRHARYVWTSPLYDDWGEGIEAVCNPVDPEWRKLLQVGGIWLGGVKGSAAQRGSGGIVLYYRAFLKRCLLESGVLAGYDRVILTRSDFLHAVPHVPPRFLDNRHLWIPDGERYGGLCDRHLICPADRFIRAISGLDAVTARPDDVLARMNHRSPWNTEQYLKLHLEDVGLADGVRHFPYTMFLVREREGRACWMRGTYDPRLGLYVPYRGEYVMSRIAKAVLGSGAWTPNRIRLWKLGRRLWQAQRYVPGLRYLKRRRQPVPAPAAES